MAFHLSHLEIEAQQVLKILALASAVEDAYRQSYPDGLWKMALARLFFVRKLNTVPSSEAAMSPLIEESWKQAAKSDDWPIARPPHFTTVARWIRDYRKAGEDIRALIDRDTDKGNRESRLGELLETIADDVIETVYMTLGSTRPGASATRIARQSPLPQQWRLRRAATR